MQNTAPSSETERRKLVRLRRRPDLTIVPQRYEGRSYYVVKDPVSLRYYRFKEQEYFLISLMDGEHTLDDAQKAFETQFRPERLRLEDLEQFGQQLLKMGLVQNESPQAGKQLYDNRQKRIRSEWMQTLTNILYIKLPIFDPDRLLTLMLPYLWWMFTRLFLLASLAFMGAALALVLTKFDVFYARLPTFESYFNFKNMIYLWVALGVVKVIHEFGHGLSCKAFNGEVHEMGFLLLCFSPAMYCNVSDAWRLPGKWHRIIISAAGIYVELMIAAAATFIWWNTPNQPFLNNLCLNLMVVCSVSTVMFNGNPLMRYDGYYVLADWIEIPNLRDRANRYLQNLAMDWFLGIEAPPEGYMELWRKILFTTFAIVSYFYKWIVTFVILTFMATFLKPYKLEVVSELLAIGAFASMIGWPIYRMITNVKKRGRLPDMKPLRVTSSACVVAVLLFAVFFVPLPVTRIRQHGFVQTQPTEITHVTIDVAGNLTELLVKEGQEVKKGKELARFTSPDLENQREQVNSAIVVKEKIRKFLQDQISKESDPNQRKSIEDHLSRAESEYFQAKASLKHVENEREKLTLRSPRDGVVVGLPPIDEIGKRWDREQGAVFCSIAGKTKLRILVPISAPDFLLLKENDRNARKRNGKIEATIRVQGHDSRTWTGTVAELPNTDEKNIPPQLTTKGGGPVAVKPGSQPNQLVPQSQVFLVGIDLDKSDPSIALGAAAHVKIHCEYRSCAWWLYRTAAITFDIGLWGL
ncbi:MAG: biotin/lipoyl-binding protein [Gemmataceae bacterium]|nr:biotin/lipoyl-binding protein [Gemmataceae bacterium]